MKLVTTILEHGVSVKLHHPSEPRAVEAKLTSLEEVESFHEQMHKLVIFAVQNGQMQKIQQELKDARPQDVEPVSAPEVAPEPVDHVASEEVAPVLGIAPVPASELSSEPESADE